MENWLKNDRNRALMPELLRKQLFLSESIEEQIKGSLDENATMDMVSRLISRDVGWVNYYRDNIDAIDIPETVLEENEREHIALENAGKSEVRFMTKLWDGDLDGAQTEFESAVRDVAIFDPMLAGWYSIWAGVAFHAAGKSDAAFDMFDEARRRIGRKLPVPRRPRTEQAKEGPSKTVIEDGIRQIVDHDLMRVNDRIAKLRAQTQNAFSKTASHKQCEEAVREIGVALGFVSSRPCTDFGKGPDNLWIDVANRKMIAFELKTDKAPTSHLTKDDIGQGLNHIEWLKTQYADSEILGLIFMTDCMKVSEKANASESMYFGTQEQLRKLLEDFFSVVDRIKVKPVLEKFIEANKVGELPEWITPGVFQRLIGKSCDC
jgi:hypothetical protein